MSIPNHSHLKSEYINGELVEKCVPNRTNNYACVKTYGEEWVLSKMSSKCEAGANLKEIHDYNVMNGVIKEDEEKLQSESIRTSMIRFKKIIQEYIACNDFGYFVTVTLDNTKVDRMDFRYMQSSFSRLARSWRRKCPNYKYLVIPELHEKNLGFHLHGCVTEFPAGELIPYTMADVESDQPLPYYIVEKVKNGELIYHCKEWDEIYGYNVIEPIVSRECVAKYITKYITKDLINMPVKTKVWHSRGLKTAETVKEYHKEEKDTTSDVEKWKNKMIELAVRTKKGITLVTETVPTVLSRPYYIEAFIHKKDHSLEEIEEFIYSQNYKSLIIGGISHGRFSF